MTEDSSPSDSTTAVSRRVGRRFGDAEITQILKAAADLQERSHSLVDDRGRGLSLEEIRQIAGEAGIDPRFVDLALSDVDAPVERRESRLAGGPLSWRFHADVDGSITDADRSRILGAIRSVMGQKGELENVFGRMEWSGDDGLGPVIIGISSDDGVISIDLSANRGSEAGLIHGLGVPFGGVFGAAALSGLVGVSGPVVVPIIAATSALCYGAARVGWAARSAFWERRLRKVVERITSIVQEVAELPAGEEESS